MAEFVKQNPSAPAGFFDCEAAGLEWLASVPGGAACARVLRYDDTSLTLERLRPVPPSAEAATEFGRRLAITHGAGAAGFGAAPDGWRGDGFFGPLDHPLPMSLTAHAGWGSFYADERLAPMLKLATGIDPTGREVICDVITRCRRGDFDDADTPSRLHGDLWSGNVMWTEAGAVLIDPAAHGGHRETDLAMLALFGCPHLERVYDGYQDVHPLRAGWRDRIALHQLYPLLAHVALFGRGYVAQTVRAARAALELS
ncbi:fructosamine kinase family protein [Mycobacterium crocinum]|uniref:Fructosamine kinase family protein n=1 Tax=Mycolicibacterium crocinum TaxID=388459 RepID=A0ABY3TKK1_9MYCO|nr:fructosamine kinase family protein [Mycolicibacterium crocinum]MCV7216507.1 fructosamine kinase family protein [Mycolicibacterium crocinum]ULN41881.1 fructosamine kinase family protein [Mycolicibacterium crocinum]